MMGLSTRVCGQLGAVSALPVVPCRPPRTTRAHSSPPTLYIPTPRRFVRTQCSCGSKQEEPDAARLKRRALVVWEQGGRPRQVLIVKKPGNAAASAMLREIGAWLTRQGIEVYVERPVKQTETPEFNAYDPTVDIIDFCVTLGGDGTVLHLAQMFEEDYPLPPTICFAMGTLGFLTPFDAREYQSCLTRVINANVEPLYCTLRTRKRCEVKYDGMVLRSHHVLNECVIDRGAFPASVNLEIFIDGAYVTTADADGLIISTPSGSTAYSMSAGGPMVAPSVPCTIVTPLAAHTLSFRPLVIPESSELAIRLPHSARSHARASFDGKHPMRIGRGMVLQFTTSCCPLPLINMKTMDSDWYEGITQKLKWNQQIRQLPTSSLDLTDQVNGNGHNIDSEVVKLPSPP